MSSTKNATDRFNLNTHWNLIFINVLLFLIEQLIISDVTSSIAWTAHGLSTRHHKNAKDTMCLSVVSVYPALAVFLLQVPSFFVDCHVNLRPIRQRVPPSRCLLSIRELRTRRSFSHSSWTSDEELTAKSVSFVMGYFSMTARIQRSDCTRATSIWELSPTSFTSSVSQLGMNTNHYQEPNTSLWRDLSCRNWHS